jgi:probable rRNA maturation factor
VILLEQDAGGVRERALALFAGRARRAVGLADDVVVLITSNLEVRKLNRRHRHKDKPTDVLSFPSAAPGHAGDIAISMDIAAANASALDHSLETELKILILHGLLHLAGYDHERDKGQMRALESRLRSQFKLPVGLIERTQAAAPKGGRR